MNLKDRIINLYRKSPKPKLTASQKATLLFDIILRLITTNQWIYLPQGKGQHPEHLLKDSAFESLEVNCFELADMFIYLCKLVGIKSASKHIYRYQPSGKLGQKLGKYTFKCFDKQFKFTDNEFCFDQHCIAQVDGKFYDLNFSCIYNPHSTPYDTSPFARAIHLLYTNKKVEALRLLHTFDQITLERTFAGESLLHIAAREEALAIASFLLVNGLNANQRSKESAQVPLAGISNMNSDLFKMLSASTEPLTAKKITQKKCFTEVVECILNENGLQEFSEIIKTIENIDFQDDDGRTLLHYAASKDDLNVVEFLLKKGANTNIREKNGKIPLEFVTEQTSPTYKLLYDNTVDIVIKSASALANVGLFSNHAQASASSVKPLSFCLWV